jgi:Leucine-rich repeat (LRR) protein
MLSVKLSAQLELYPHSLPMYQLQELPDKPTSGFYLHDLIDEDNWKQFQVFCEQENQYQWVEALTLTVKETQWLQWIPWRKMKQLKYLAIVDTDLSKGSPDSFFKATQLIELTLQSCKISFLDRRMSVFKNLRQLSLSGNYELSEFPFTASDFPQLTQLILASTSIKKLNAFPKLIFLDMNACKLITIPDAIFQMDSLEALDLSSNFISGISKSFARLKKLRILQLQNNHLTHLEGVLDSNLTIQHLGLWGNSFSKEVKIQIQKRLYFVKRLQDGF